MGKKNKQENGRKRILSNRWLAYYALGLVGFMLLLSLFSAPLYRAFCRATGFGGTPITVTKEAVQSSSDRTVKVNFNYDLNPGLQWKISAPESIAALPVGKTTEVTFVAENFSKGPITGIAAYNVTPTKASPYVSKLQCFCFDRQTLQPHQKQSMVVRFFIDPKIVEDKTVAELSDVTLNYSFF